MRNWLDKANLAEQEIDHQQPPGSGFDRNVRNIDKPDS